MRAVNFMHARGMDSWQGPGVTEPFWFFLRYGAPAHGPNAIPRQTSKTPQCRIQGLGPSLLYDEQSSKLLFGRHPAHAETSRPKTVKRNDSMAPAMTSICSRSKKKYVKHTWFQQLKSGFATFPAY